MGLQKAHYYNNNINYDKNRTISLEHKQNKIF